MDYEVSQLRDRIARLESELAMLRTNTNSIRPHLFDQDKGGGVQQGDTTNPKILGQNTEGTEPALIGPAQIWSRPTDLRAVDLWVVCREVYNHAGDKKLYAYPRRLRWDSAGMLYDINVETRIEVDAATNCQT